MHSLSLLGFISYINDKNYRFNKYLAYQINALYRFYDAFFRY